MNRLEGTIAFVRGSGAIRVIGLDTPSGRIHAMVLDTGSSDRTYAEGVNAAGLFKETSVVFHASPGSSLSGKVVSIVPGDVLVALEVALDATGTQVRAHLPPEELPGALTVGDPVRLHVPASAVALELR
jgi:molybdopterin-binding protein